jgi:hypothetical protein
VGAHTIAPHVRFVTEVGSIHDTNSYIPLPQMLFPFSQTFRFLKTERNLKHS